MMKSRTRKYGEKKYTSKAAAAAAHSGDHGINSLSHIIWLNRDFIKGSKFNCMNLVFSIS